MILVFGLRLEGHSVTFLAIQTHLSCRFLLAVDFLGLRRSGSSAQFIDPPQDFPKQVPGHSYFGQLERDVPARAWSLSRTALLRNERHDSRVHQGSMHQVKHIVVNPGGRLSSQYHHRRAEHWIIVSGTGEVTVDDETRTVGENQSVFIPLGSTHRLFNPGAEPLHLIEVQYGDYLGEDDIVRLDDVYGRAPLAAAG